MANNGYRIGAFAAVTLVVLRIAIGFHFLCAGLEKLNPSFSAAGMLRSSVGPWADFYKSLAPMPHDWDQLGEKPWPNAGDFAAERVKVDGREIIAYPTEAYGPWLARVADDWHETAETFKKLPGMSEQQQTEADKVFERHYASLATYAESIRGEVEEWNHEGERLEAMYKMDEAESLPFVQERIAEKEADLASAWRPWVAGVEAEERMYLDELHTVLSEEQRSSALMADKVSDVLEPSGRIDLINKTVTWFTLIVGGLLIVGLFTRVASVAAIVFLISIITTQPSWLVQVSDMAKLVLPYQGIEIFSLLVLAAVGAGTWAGFDGLLFRRKD